MYLRSRGSSIFEKFAIIFFINAIKLIVFLILQENSLSYEILRKVSPKEADFLADKSQQVRVRFR